MDELAAEFGTPLYVYDAELIESRFHALQRAFSGVELLVAYSVKANGNLGILDRLGRLGAGADIVSGGELFRALRSGIPADRIVFAGVGKTQAELRNAVAARILAFHVESAGELTALEAVASEVGIPAGFGLRVNPDIVSPAHHDYTRTGHAATKFGIPVDEVVELYRWARDRPFLRVRGIDAHIGSDIRDPEPYTRMLDVLLGIVDQLRGEGVDLEYVDVGGGYGVPRSDEPGMPVERLAELVVPRVRSAGLRLVLEPGRFIVAEAGTLLTTVLYVKQSGGKTFVITDGGMTELIRPSLYAGFHAVHPVVARPDGEDAVVDVVGPICETGDFLALDRTMQVPRPGDVLAVRTAGAYGSSMASNYNSRPRPAEILVEGGRPLLIRTREAMDDLIRGEIIPPVATRPLTPDGP
jgi:diaminopimelate decarboxylase